VLQLPTYVDACGENGEYHSYCFDGPIFKTPIHVQVAQKIYMPLQTANIVCPISTKEINTKGFWYAELLLK
jgi:diphthamide synthase (EF-2-diphthine--ammonia ligase)